MSDDSPENIPGRSWVSPRSYANPPTPPAPPVIVGRDGKTYEFGSDVKIPPGTFSFEIKDINPELMKMLYGQELSDYITHGAGAPMFPTPNEYAKVKDGLMTDNEEILRRRIEQARRDIDEYTEKLSWLESLPSEPIEVDENGDGPVVFFTKKYGHAESRGWDYVAVRIADALSGTGAWYVTGGNKVGLNCVQWRQLLAFVFMKETKDTSPVIYRATAWEVL
jgi:hypothetical protein